jgi:hypothetical protein
MRFAWHRRIEAALPRTGLSQYLSFCTLNDHSPRSHCTWHCAWAEVPASLVGSRKMARQVLPSAQQYHRKISSIPNMGALKLFGVGKFGLGTIVA